MDGLGGLVDDDVDSGLPAWAIILIVIVIVVIISIIIILIIRYTTERRDAEAKTRVRQRNIEKARIDLQRLQNKTVKLE